jgi:lipopolysaccharide transport system ATP-binding protein
MSSSDLALSVRGLSKAYTIRHNQSDHITLAELALDRVRHPLRRSAREQFWALDDVSFDLEHGSVVGLIGRNGAGKSTLLKLLTRITEPTAGEVLLWGRVGSLLEVGTGFHPELTGRENIFLNGSILGMTKNEITRQFDAIVAFAGVESFLDTPVKRYSSGMQVRLAFAVAAHLETEILLLDEVLAVGDATFQDKCLAKVSELATTGRTAVIVSHNASLVERVASTVILLDRGHLTAMGRPVDVLDTYAEQSHEVSTHADLANARRYEQGLGSRARFVDIRALTDQGDFTRASGVSYAVTLVANEPLEDLVFSMSIHTADGQKLGSTFAQPPQSLAPGVETEVVIHLPEPPLAPGSYLLGVAVGFGDGTGNFLDMVGDVMQFEIAPTTRPDGRVEAWDHAWGTIAFPSATAEKLMQSPIGSTRANDPSGSAGPRRDIPSAGAPATG